MPTDEPDLIRQRLANQQLIRSRFRNPADVVAWMGAMQAQDYPAARWGIGLRGNGISDAAVQGAFDEGHLLRTHVLRPTWHFVTPADIRWMLTLSAPRVHRTCGHYYRKFEIDAATMTRCRRVLERALRGGRHLTRRELGSVMQRSGIVFDNLRLAFLIMHAELDGVMCSGPYRGKDLTYALLEERVPPAPRLTSDEALAELTRRYFTSHGPATVRDFVWWSGLTVRQARAGLELLGPALISERVGDLTYWFAKTKARTTSDPPSAYLLPIYDEYLIAYKDRRLTATRANRQADRLVVDAYGHWLVVDGRFAGAWRRSLNGNSVQVAAVPYVSLTRVQRRALNEAVDRYATFLNVPATLTCST